jgi:hypothetical protein
VHGLDVGGSAKSEVELNCGHYEVDFGGERSGFG